MEKQQLLKLIVGGDYGSYLMNNAYSVFRKKHPEKYYIHVVDIRCDVSITGEYRDKVYIDYEHGGVIETFIYDTSKSY